ncbi:MAG TPA: hypothetical protein VGK67_07415 [Myxococcales bacterium]
MGFFDFLNPKKKFEKLLADKVKGPAIEEAVKLIKEKGEEKAKEELSGWVAEKIGAAANELGIPSALDGIKDKIIEDASAKVVDEAFEEAKKRMAGGAEKKAASGGAGYSA